MSGGQPEPDVRRSAGARCPEGVRQRGELDLHGDLFEDAMQRLNLNVPEATGLALKRLAAKAGLKESELARELLVRAVQSEERAEVLTVKRRRGESTCSENAAAQALGGVGEARCRAVTCWRYAE